MDFRGIETCKPAWAKRRVAMEQYNDRRGEAESSVLGEGSSKSGKVVGGNGPERAATNGTTHSVDQRHGRSATHNRSNDGDHGSTMEKPSQMSEAV